MEVCLDAMISEDAADLTLRPGHGLGHEICQDCRDSTLGKSGVVPFSAIPPALRASSARRVSFGQVHASCTLLRRSASQSVCLQEW